MTLWYIIALCILGPLVLVWIAVILADAYAYVVETIKEAHDKQKGH
jgi:hypothetical protein